ncbi:DUF3137 domain-containing protein [Campylobacter sp. MOP7]|uniref:DUF3137 domain-containing protein n=1 Tax=Campylobacter canis TaxID=3378588 RepID=UPI00387E854B
MDLNQAILLTRQKQIEYQKTVIKISVLFALFVCLIFFAWSFVDTTVAKIIIGTICGIVFIVSCLYFLYVLLNSENDYLLFYKDVFVKTAITDLELNLKYEHWEGVKQSEFKKVGIFRCINIKGEDQISGELYGIKFYFSEAKNINNSYLCAENMLLFGLSIAAIIYERFANDNFNGSVLICELNKEFENQIIIVNQELAAERFSDKRSVDNIDFAGEFCVFTEDETKARDFLTYSFMKRLSALMQNLNDKFSLCAAFVDDKFYLFLNDSCDKFQTSIFSKSVSLKTAHNIQAQIRDILDIIKELNLMINKEKR